MIKEETNERFMKAFLILVYSSLVFGHGGEDHSKVKVKKIAKTFKGSSFVKIKRTYLKKIKPIFKKSCFDCHSNQVNYPWYYKLPGIKQFIDSDISKAKKHLDFSGDYPFKSHETPVNDLKSIKKDLAEDIMPPFNYRLLHPNKSLSAKEKEEILKWVDDSLEIIDEEVNE